jgi:hypothetical protein
MVVWLGRVDTRAEMRCGNILEVDAPEEASWRPRSGKREIQAAAVCDHHAQVGRARHP